MALYITGVAPHVGAWIEINNSSNDRSWERSHPTWVRGLKSDPLTVNRREPEVAPHVGAWIEILNPTQAPSSILVAPHVGAWIEI